jgi:hypothetical protein
MIVLKRISEKIKAEILKKKDAFHSELMIYGKLNTFLSRIETKAINFDKKWNSVYGTKAYATSDKDVSYDEAKAWAKKTFNNEILWNNTLEKDQHLPRGVKGHFNYQFAVKYSNTFNQHYLVFYISLQINKETIMEKYEFNIRINADTIPFEKEFGAIFYHGKHNKRFFEDDVRELGVNND